MSSPKNDLKFKLGKPCTNRSRHFAAECCAASEVEKSPENWQSAASQNCLPIAVAIIAKTAFLQNKTEHEKQATSSPKNIFKTATGKASQFFTLPWMLELPTNWSGYQSIRENSDKIEHEKRMISSPSIALKSATGMELHFFTTPDT